MKFVIWALRPIGPALKLMANTSYLKMLRHIKILIIHYPKENSKI